MSRWLAVLPLLSGCWTLDLPDVDVDRLPLTPAVGAPEGWFVEGFETVLDCPDGEPARFWIVYPTWADKRVDSQAPSVPMALVFHSGALDYVPDPDPADPTAGPTWQQDLGGENRLTAAWAGRHVFAGLGLYPNYERAEDHAGTLAAALAAKGIASLWMGNCWGDLWHNRQSSEQPNNVALDQFDRNGRTGAEFAWRYAFEQFPESNPLVLPVRADTERIFVVGLGDGSRAVGELLAVLENADQDPTLDPVYRYRPHAVFLDSPVDDYRPYFADAEAPVLAPLRAALARVFPGVSPNNPAPLDKGSVSARLAANPQGCGHGFNLPQRIGVAFSCNDSTWMPATNSRLFARLGYDPAGECTDENFVANVVRDEEPAKNEFTCVEVPVWIHRDAALARPLTNRDPSLAKAVADFLGEGIEGLDPAYLPGGAVE